MFDFHMPKAKPDHLSWKYLATPAGCKHLLFIAGDPVGIPVHYHHGTRPCRAKLTDNVLSCALCATEKNPDNWKGFLPCFDEWQKRWLVMFSRDELPRILRASLHEPIVVTRGLSNKHPVEIRPERPAKRVLPLTGSVPAPQCIKEQLLVFWKDDELSRELRKRWLMMNRRPKTEGNTGPLLAPSKLKVEEPKIDAKPVATKLGNWYVESSRKPDPSDAAPSPAPPEVNGQHR